MEKHSGHSISLQVAAPRGIAAVRARMPAARVPAVFAQYLNQVYAAARKGAVHVDGQNIFVYRSTGRDDEIDVEFGVGVTSHFPAAGPVIYSELPVGEVATTTHWGDYARLGDAHAALIAWCRAHGRELAGPRWEVYGHWTDDPTRLRTDIYYLLQPSM
ncbi:MAG TPA: GyrI-like domain-containing protein [Gemmatimonadaceae bacterium]|nr:GyrI-like domain-containing protein [Gemmatimonadaceae bacterium]